MRHKNAFKTFYRTPSASIQAREDRFYATYVNSDGETVGSEYIDLENTDRLPFELVYEGTSYRAYLVSTR